MSNPALALVVDIQGWKKIPGLRARIQKAAMATAAHLPPKFRFGFSATILLTGDARIRQLNCDFRGIDQPTNVLSFPQFTPAELTKIGKQVPSVELGDIALSYAYIKKECSQTNKLLINHVAHLVIHGLLHLFGYDHGTDREARMMEKLETDIMNSMYLPNPYASEYVPTHSVRGKIASHKTSARM